MGLTLHYELRLPERMSRADARRVLSTLREFALALPFEFVSPLQSVPKTRSGGPDRARHGWLAFWASLVAEPWDEDAPQLTGDVSSAQGFLVNPGQGCESAIVGFLLRADETGGAREWYWQCSCKTQYASTVSEEHFVRCHTSLVSLLDFASKSGVEVVVTDEGQYWETRDEGRLLAEVRRMNHLVAALAGQVSDRLGPEHKVEASIFEHPRFEHLEMGERDVRNDEGTGG